MNIALRWKLGISASVEVGESFTFSVNAGHTVRIFLVN